MSKLEALDLWPLVEPELEGIATLQFPWSVRAMDEAGAALDALKPDAIVTYAEAGGWGRALMLEARRRGIPSVALQHGFIYRHWLNYRHEPDEVRPSAANAADRGFPLSGSHAALRRIRARVSRARRRFPAGIARRHRQPAARPARRVRAGVERLDARGPARFAGRARQ